MRTLKRLAPLALLAFVAACGGGPDEQALTKDVHQRLSQALPAGTVTLSSLDRRGSQADTRAPAGETRRTVYFDAVLKLDKDFDFGAWDQPGVAGLVSALGAGPKGVAGVTSGGNKSGDKVVVHGTASYKREGSGWAGVPPRGHLPATAPSYATASATGPAAILQSMREVIDQVPSGASPQQRDAIERELIAARASIRARLARINAGYPLAAGPEHGQYLRFAQALSAAVGARTVPLVTRGGDENIRLLREGSVVLALAQADGALDAYEGRGNFAKEGAYTTLRAVGSLYPEPMHVLVRNDSRFNTVGDLRGRRVAIGVPGAASRTTALRVLEAHGLGAKDVAAVDLPLGDALVALRAGEVDAVMQVIGVPSDSIRDALAEIPLRLLPLDERAVAALVGAKSGYFAFAIPRASYASQPRDVRTIATAALLLAGPDLSETEIDEITRFVFAIGRDLAGRGSAQGVQVSAANARHGASIPLHVASEKALDAMAKAPAK